MGRALIDGADVCLVCSLREEILDRMPPVDWEHPALLLPFILEGGEPDLTWSDLWVARSLHWVVEPLEGTVSPEAIARRFG